MYQECTAEQNAQPLKTESGENGREEATQSEHATVVASHYNNLEEKGLQERFNSPIFHMRNFNNWVKAVLINTFADKLREQEYGRRLTVLDICCGKGGDLLKWQKMAVKHVVCADIASVSVEQCRVRHEDMVRRDAHTFTAEFVVADCTRERLRQKYADPSMSFDLVSCQFGFHYCFESLPQAECMLRNVSECLRPGGYFIGTIPDAREVVARCRRDSSLSFQNRVMKLKLLLDPEKEGFPLFGAKYDFSLEGVVDCPEFLVYFPLLVKLAARHGLQLDYTEKFHELYENNKSKYSHYFSRMKVFESFPPRGGARSMGPAEEYRHAESHLASSGHDNPHCTVGTISKAEWEASTIYLAFAFKKCKSTLDKDGKPVYEMKTSDSRDRATTDSS